MRKDSAMCEHREFSGTLNVHRLEDTIEGESLRCMVDLRIQCTACASPLLFALPLGINTLQGATMSLDGQEARLTARIGIPKEVRGATGFQIIEQAPLTRQQ